MVSFLKSLVEKILENLIFIFSVLGVSLLVLFGFLFWDWYHERADQKLAEQWFQAEKKGEDAFVQFLEQTAKDGVFTPQGAAAALTLARKNSDCAKTQSLLEPYRDQTKSAVLDALLEFEMGHCLIQESNWEGAEDFFEALHKRGASLLLPLHLAEEARAKARLSKWEESDRILSEITQKQGDDASAIFGLSNRAGLESFRIRSFIERPAHRYEVK